MQIIIALLLALFTLPAWADINGVFSSDGNADTSVRNSALLILNGNFGGGTVTILIKGAESAECQSGWCTTGQTYSADDLDVIDLGDTTGIVRVALSGSTSPDLYYEIRD